LIVVGADRIHRQQVQETLGALETAGAHIFGIVMNKIDRREAGTYAYDSYAPTLDKSSPAKTTPAKQSVNSDPTIISIEPEFRREKLDARSH
jgi:succinoglycan biosynthesis transport protein ExoP